MHEGEPGGLAGVAGRGEVPSPFSTYLDALFGELRLTRDGEVATYIPELGNANPEQFAICVCTTDGFVYSVGDAETSFTIQSVSKPFVYGMALEDHGRDAVLERVGVEPSGNAFNAIVVDDASRPYNPMVNAGAITTTGMIAGEARIRQTLGAYAGRALDIDDAVYESERSTGDLNRAIAHLMRSFGVIADDAEAAVDLYFRQCAVAVTCRDLAIMAATLANRGTNPVTGARAVAEDCVEHVLSVMTSCGMYDASGAWMYNVGLPAKSGVSGGVLAVLPGQLGIGVFSPRLDVRGNSVRGVQACERIAHDLHLHPFRYQLDIGGVVRATYSCGDVHSSRIRTVAELEVLAKHGSSARVFELQGDLFFATAERVFRSVTESLDEVDTVVLDLGRVDALDGAAAAMIDVLERSLAESGREFFACGRDDQPTLDDVLERCEQRIIETHGSHDLRAPSDLAYQELLRGLGAEEMTQIAAMVEHRHFEAGEVVFREGSPSESILFVLSGSLSAMLPSGDGIEGTARPQRLARFGPGLAVGELALIGDGNRSADIVADVDSTVAVLEVAAVERLAGAVPAVSVTLHYNLARILARRLRRANEHLKLLSR
jgi:glutaminase